MRLSKDFCRFYSKGNYDTHIAINTITITIKTVSFVNLTTTIAGTDITTTQALCRISSPSPHRINLFDEEQVKPSVGPQLQASGRRVDASQCVCPQAGCPTFLQRQAPN
ncbi:hypothetical protein ElyMa_002717500 [Elysia marginata]|uniref:Uncharacterized protein n=1 Tax=Elysia marginata TaxID=1093978 RepID=A0AAV4HF97_9GAST|nr:hypothetical protein ElyMa_002717500 [Elysia marginata]